MKPTKFWVYLFSILLIAASAATLFIKYYSGSSTAVSIYQDGKCIYNIDLSTVTEPYEIEIEGKVSNIIAVENGKICVKHATCPDQICVNQGWLTDSSSPPIICLPNSLVIQIDSDKKGGTDAVTQ